MKITFCFIFADGTRDERTARFPNASFFYTYADNWISQSQAEDSNPAVDYEILSVR